MGDKTKVGEWESPFELLNVAVHATLLPNGKILYWGRRADPKAKPPADIFASMNEHATLSYILDPSDNFKSRQIPSQFQPLTQPDNTKNPPTTTVNLFCSGHCIQPDGTVFVIGGHEKDGFGLDQVSVFDPAIEQWTSRPKMITGRWYPSALTLADGRVLAISGSTQDYVPDPRPQIWQTDGWVDVSAQLRALYPRMHLFDGRVFVSGPNKSTQFLDVNSAGIGVNKDGVKLVGAWTAGPDRAAGHREYAPSVMYDRGKIIYIGGGNDPAPHDDNNGGDPNAWRPTNQVELIDLKQSPLKWTITSNMKRGRQQHNGTVLPDGTVLVTGGTGSGGFNNLNLDGKSPPGPTHVPELWDPSTSTWTDMAPEDFDRCYHSVALLLPDGRVLSAGGGEYDSNLSPEDCPRVNLTNAQMFKPPYFFVKDKRPNVTNWPKTVQYGQDFNVTVDAADKIDRASWVRLGSVTHSCNFNQSLMFLTCKQSGATVTVTPPKNASEAQPGHYMLFVLTKTNVPCVLAPIIQIGPVPTLPPNPVKPTTATVSKMVTTHRVALSSPEHNQQVMEEQARPAVTVGLTPLCYYGLGPCWSGAYDALRRISDIDVVRPMPSQADSVAFVYLKQDIIPDIDVWRREFRLTANGAYIMRGIEMTLSGMVTKENEKLALSGTITRPDVLLEPFQASDQILWDKDKKAQKPVTNEETEAYSRLSAALAGHVGGLSVQVTGWLQKLDTNKFSIHVRKFET